jgi:toxin YhaV
MTQRKSDDALVINGWSIYAHPKFLDALEALVELVDRLRTKAPQSYKQKRPTKLLAAILQLAFDVIPNDPSRPEFRQGSTLGDHYKHWFRAKFFQQYRLFFRYHREARVIIYAWVNDEDTKRAYESSDDAYRTFRRMLDSGNPPDNWETLLSQARKASARVRTAAAKRK